MLMKFISETGKDWDKWLPYGTWEMGLFAYSEVPQASTGFAPFELLFTPFELLFAHQVRRPLDVLKTSWEEKDKPCKRNILSYVLQMREMLQHAADTAQASLRRPPGKNKRLGMTRKPVYECSSRETKCYYDYQHRRTSC